MRNRHTLKFGRIQSTTATTAQVEEHGGEIRPDLPRPQMYGHASNPVNGSRTATICQDGDADNCIVLCFGESPITLAKGDSILYSGGGAFVHCEGGIAKINGDAFGGLTKLPDLVIAINLFLAAYNTHTHGSAVPAPALQAVPLVQAALENAGVKHG